MSRISNTDKYPSTLDIKDEDIVLGSKGNDKKTRNFKFSDIGSYIKNFFYKSDVKGIPSFESHLLGFNENGELIKIPVPNFEGTVGGDLDGNYYDDIITEETLNQNYI